jgi:hypothetical protein
LSRRVKASSFEAELAELLTKLKKGATKKGKGTMEEMTTEWLRSIGSYYSSIPVDHGGDRISLARLAVPADDRALLETAIGNHLDELKGGLEKFVERCTSQFPPMVSKIKEFPPVSAKEVFELLRRLEGHILPNIFPDGSLRGTPASFGAVLNAAAIYRICILASAEDVGDPKAIYRAIQMIERLTAKALEVSFIQRDFNAWQLSRENSVKTDAVT